MTTPGGPGLPKYLRVAAVIRRQIADGTLRPGQPAPSGAELSRAFGFSTLTCRKALRALIAEGLLVPGPSSNARPRVADPHAPDLDRDLADAARALSAGLAARRHAAGLTQAELAWRSPASRSPPSATPRPAGPGSPAASGSAPTTRCARTATCSACTTRTAPPAPRTKAKDQHQI